MNKPKLLWLNITVFSLTGLITLLGVPAYALIHGFDGWQVAAMMGGARSVIIGFADLPFGLRFRLKLYIS